MFQLCNCQAHTFKLALHMTKHEYRTPAVLSNAFDKLSSKLFAAQLVQHVFCFAKLALLHMSKCSNAWSSITGVSILLVPPLKVLHSHHPSLWSELRVVC